MATRGSIVEGGTVAEAAARIAARARAKVAAPTTARHVELAWQGAVREHWRGHAVKAFTGRERGNARSLLREYEPDYGVSLLRWAVGRWAWLRQKPQLMRVLPDEPTFAAFYAWRETISAAWSAERRRASGPDESVSSFRARMEAERAAADAEVAAGGRRS